MPAPLMTSRPAPALAPVPPEPVWSAMTPLIVVVCPAVWPAPSVSASLPCRKMAEPKAEPAPAPARPRGPAGDRSGAERAAPDGQRRALLDEDVAAGAEAAAARPVSGVTACKPETPIASPKSAAASAVAAAAPAAEAAVAAHRISPTHRRPRRRRSRRPRQRPSYLWRSSLRPRRRRPRSRQAGSRRRPRRRPRRWSSRRTRRRLRWWFRPPHPRQCRRRHRALCRMRPIRRRRPDQFPRRRRRQARRRLRRLRTRRRRRRAPPPACPAPPAPPMAESLLNATLIKVTLARGRAVRGIIRHEQAAACAHAASAAICSVDLAAAI